MGHADHKRVFAHRLFRKGLCECMDCGPAKRQGPINRRIERARLKRQFGARVAQDLKTEFSRD